MLKIGDKVELILSKDEINQIINNNLELRGEIMKCYNTKIGTIVDKFLPNSIINEPYYCLDIADNIAWKESELKLLN